MKKVMVLGAGRGQIPLINLCHKHGAYVIVVSPKGDYPGFQICDEAFYEDIKDKESVLKKAQELSIDAIITDQLDQGVSTVAYVAEKMGLPGISYDVAIKFTNKYAMRNAARKLGINVPEAYLLETKEDIATLDSQNLLTFPMIMKPVDGSASNGIFKVESTEDITKNLDNSMKYSKNHAVILEQFIDGREFVVEAYTHNYKVYNLMVGHRDYFNVPGAFIPSATVFQDAEHVESELEKQLMSVNEALVKGFGLKFGITHGEFLVEKETGKIYLVEIAARGGGVFISSEIIPASTGVNANELLVKDALKIYDAEIEVKQGAAAYFCFLTPEGTIKSINGIDNLKKIPGVRAAYLDNVEIGMETSRIVDKYSRKGPVIVQGINKKDCYAVFQQVKKILDVKIEARDGIMKGILWN